MLEKPLNYGIDRGWRVHIHKMNTRPKYRTDDFVHTFGVWGFCSLEPSTKIPRAEIGVLPYAKEDHATIALLHELGHCEQYSLLPIGRPLGYNKALWPERITDIEEDAWHRGLRIAGELGIHLTVPMKELIHASFNSYFTGREPFTNSQSSSLAQAIDREYGR